MVELKSKVILTTMCINENGRQELTLFSSNNQNYNNETNENVLNNKKSRQTGNWASTASTILGQKMLDNDNKFKGESAKFSVQPRCNALVTPDHPIFMNQIQKLQL